MIAAEQVLVLVTPEALCINGARDSPCCIVYKAAISGLQRGPLKRMSNVPDKVFCLHKSMSACITHSTWLQDPLLDEVSG